MGRKSFRPTTNGLVGKYLRSKREEGQTTGDYATLQADAGRLTVKRTASGALATRRLTAGDFLHSHLTRMHLQKGAGRYPRPRQGRHIFPGGGVPIRKA